MLFPAYNAAGPQLRSLGLRKAVLLSVLLPQLLGTSPLYVRADESTLQQVVDNMAHALGINTGGSATSTSSARPSATNATTTSLTTPLSSSSPSGTSTANSTTSANATTTQGRAVFAHFIVGNTYNYTVDSWFGDIVLAASKGIDAFALNVGADAWESSQIANAFNAASKYNGNANNAAAPFRLFFSFDMSSLPCSQSTDAAVLES